MTIRSFVAAGTLIAIAASPAAAQFTSVVVPAKQQRAGATAAAATSQTAQARRDTSVAARLTDMKAWVDSAAGLKAPRLASATTDSSTGAVAQGVGASRADTAARARSENTTTPAGTKSFREGAPAPNTASLLPLIALLGAGTLLVGLALIRPGVPAPVSRRR